MTTATAQQPGRLHGRVALVTGAGAGLGGASAIALARAGARLVVCDIDPQALQGTAARLHTLGATHLALRCDVAGRAAVDAMFAQTAAAFGSLDVLVNNAARVPHSPAETERRNRHYACATTPQPRQSLSIVSGLSDEDWLKWWDVNMHGVFWCTRAALRLMAPRRWGRASSTSRRSPAWAQPAGTAPATRPPRPESLVQVLVPALSRRPGSAGP